MTKEYFREIEDCAAFNRAGAVVVTHPKKSGQYAKILTAYPKDGAGRLTVYVVDGFGDKYTTQKGTASGYGYDKFTAALAGLIIDGLVLSDHAHRDYKSQKFLSAYSKAIQSGDKTKADRIVSKAKKAGYDFANWTSNIGGWQSCFKLPGLDYLKALGYQIIRVL